MGSCPEISKVNVYFLRSFLLLIEGGLYISKLILVRECNNSESDLDELLERNRSKLKHLFHGKQLKKLYPDHSKADINTWDLQLTVGVLINVFRRSLGSTESEKLRLLRDLRNDIYMHCTSASLDEEEYDDVKEKLDETITTLASTFDETVQNHCSECIINFTTGELDAVRPSSETLNGFSQSCQKKFKVIVNTELFVGGPSEHWISLYEETLDTIFNHVESMGSEDDGFQEVQENVKKMLAYLEDNKDVVFKGSKRECIMLCFECENYESFLHLLEDIEREEYTSNLRSLSDSIMSFFKPNCSMSISSRVTTESLQSALIAILMSNQEEQQIQTIEISSEDTGNDMREMTTHHTGDGTKVNVESQKPLVLGLESSSGDGLIYLLQTFQERQFSDSVMKVARSLSSYHGKEVTLKASINVGDLFEAFEESVSRDVKIGTTAKNVDEPTFVKTVMPSASDEEKTFTIDRIRVIKSVNYLIVHFFNVSISYQCRALPFTDTDYEYIMKGSSHENRMDRFFAKILAGSKELQNSFLENKYSDSNMVHMKNYVNRQTVSEKDIKDLSALEASMNGKCQRPNGVKPLIKFTCSERCLLLKSNINSSRISAYLLSKIIISPQEFSEIIERVGIETKTEALLNKLEKCSQKHYEEFCEALTQHCSPDIADAIMKDKQLQTETKRDERISSHDVHSPRFQMPLERQSHNCSYESDDGYLRAGFMKPRYYDSDSVDEYRLISPMQQKRYIYNDSDSEGPFSSMQHKRYPYSDSDPHTTYRHRRTLQKNEMLENKCRTLQKENRKLHLKLQRLNKDVAFMRLGTGIGFKFSQRSDDLDAVGKIKSEKPLTTSVEYEKDTLKSGEAHGYHSYPVTPIKTTRTQFETKQVSTFDSDDKPRYYGKSGAEISKKVNEDDKQPGQVRYQTKAEKRKLKKQLKKKSKDKLVSPYEFISKSSLGDKDDDGEAHGYHSYPVTPIKTTRTQFETKQVSTFDSDVKPRYYGKFGAEISKKVNEDDKQPGQVRYQTKAEKRKLNKQLKKKSKDKLVSPYEFISTSSLGDKDDDGEAHGYHSYPVTPIVTTRTQIETKQVSTFDSDVKPRYYGKSGAEISKKVNEDDKQPGQVRYQTKAEKRKLKKQLKKKSKDKLVSPYEFISTSSLGDKDDDGEAHGYHSYPVTPIKTTRTQFETKQVSTFDSDVKPRYYGKSGAEISKKVNEDDKQPGQVRYQTKAEKIKLKKQLKKKSKDKLVSPYEFISTSSLGDKDDDGRVHRLDSYPAKPIKTASTPFEPENISKFEKDEKPKFYSKSEKEILEKVNEDDMQHDQVMYHKEMETEKMEGEDDIDEIKRKLKSRDKLYESLSSFQ